MRWGITCFRRYLMHPLPALGMLPLALQRAPLSLPLRRLEEHREMHLQKRRPPLRLLT